MEKMFNAILRTFHTKSILAITIFHHVLFSCNSTEPTKKTSGKSSESKSTENTSSDKSSLDSTIFLKGDVHTNDQHLKSDDQFALFVNPQSFPVYKHGGEMGLRQFIKDNLIYPAHQSIEGQVYIGFTVDTLGCVKDISIKKGLTEETDQEAIRIVKMLTYIPGTFHGKPKEMAMVIPIRFSKPSSNNE
jgi:TonB family protein